MKQNVSILRWDFRFHFVISGFYVEFAADLINQGKHKSRFDCIIYQSYLFTYRIPSIRSHLIPGIMHDRSAIVTEVVDVAEAGDGGAEVELTCGSGKDVVVVDGHVAVPVAAGVGVEIGKAMQDLNQVN